MAGFFAIHAQHSTTAQHSRIKVQPSVQRQLQLHVQHLLLLLLLLLLHRLLLALFRH